MAGIGVATAPTARGDGRYAAELDPDWQIAGKLNGGDLLSRPAGLRSPSSARTSRTRWPPARTSWRPRTSARLS